MHTQACQTQCMGIYSIYIYIHAGQTRPFLLSGRSCLFTVKHRPFPIRSIRYIIYLFDLFCASGESDPMSGELPPLDVGAFLSTTSMSSTQSVTLEQLICSSLVTCTSCIIMHQRQLFSYMHHEYWEFIRYTWRIKAYCFTSAVEHPGEIWCQHPWTICSL